ncbi:succinylglutamate desuccinylase [Aminobacterium sp. MB27-C1]|jgi:hypothetical protein|uniref:succinylglutamate desuccinylase n=1 Tax=unclassified Aminobacterium TaxID=2685012 RepID=UPI0027DB1B8B|nr:MULTISPECIES: succinylglutamate desuccinylase [unclassified Aminobacterium]MEA4877448.1 succinylglutamate desuccinylase [Aminobacterium sp.]WMI71773.1 succinylglutamate desuccinylase [Aminobacterium sp. MB27-C1]
MKGKLNGIKILSLVVALVFVAIAGREFYGHRHFKEPVVPSPSLTEVKKLSDYEPTLKGTPNDSNVYIFDSGVPGGTALLLGGTHPEEPACNLGALLVAENVKVEQGRLIVIIRANRSASTCTRMGEAYPTYYYVKTPWGQKQFRMGDRCTNPLDSWPDPEVYIHYPSRQMLAYMDIRNLNRTWPGRPNGALTERTTWAMTQLIRQEKVDIAVDLHEAELEYPVENTIVSHEKGQAVAAMTSMTLTAELFEVPLSMEFSPKALHGLSHREIGDHTDAMSLLVEVAEPMLDRIRGITDEYLLMTGRDEFVMKAGEHKLLYAPIDERGWPIDVRVGRHSSTFQKMLEFYSLTAVDRPVVISGVPGYTEVIENTLGTYMKNPEDAPAQNIYYD